MNRKLLKSFIAVFFLSFAGIGFAKPAAVSSLSAADLKDFDKNPPEVKKLIKSALALTKQNLTYKYGSNHPKNKGMDCSGTINYLLKLNGLKAPRQADQQYLWTKNTGNFTPTIGTYSLIDAKFNNLKPGDILFWRGTYNIKRLASHSMIYLGIEKKTNRPVMFGASDGRRHNGKRITGVSVFDFVLPKKGKKAKFLGYGPIPGLSYGNTAIASKSKKKCRFFKFLCKKK